MRTFQTRRRFLTNLAWTGAGATLLPRRAMGEPPPEVTTVRFGKIPVICFAPQYVCEELLRAEGFTDVRYVDSRPDSSEYPQDLGRGKYDFATSVIAAYAAAIDAGVPITILSGVHAGCYELFGHNGIRGIADLKAKRVGTGARVVRTPPCQLRR